MCAYNSQCLAQYQRIEFDSRIAKNSIIVNIVTHVARRLDAHENETSLWRKQTDSADDQKAAEHIPEFFSFFAGS